MTLTDLSNHRAHPRRDWHLCVRGCRGKREGEDGGGGEVLRDLGKRSLDRVEIHVEVPICRLDTHIEQEDAALQVAEIHEQEKWMSHMVLYENELGGGGGGHRRAGVIGVLQGVESLDDMVPASSENVGGELVDMLRSAIRK
ncbi:hypothetical protein Hypma_010407 [Hypsizygus marmoreus]|uniref:Uncharacterized protein n=1 Tax=Hypsizygus marmoreus TaxID=39966 RepID=A0A369JRX3_HYPMA|nr:hypothetical protein Hypma_010407 [Hypsizygus marmoreus]